MEGRETRGSLNSHSLYLNPHLKITLYLALFRLCVWDLAVHSCSVPPSTPYSLLCDSAPHFKHKKMEGKEGGVERETG